MSPIQMVAHQIFSGFPHDNKTAILRDVVIPLDLVELGYQNVDVYFLQHDIDLSQSLDQEN